MGFGGLPKQPRLSKQILAFSGVFHAPNPQAKDRERELGDLKSFKTEASRIIGVKRQLAKDRWSYSSDFQYC